MIQVRILLLIDGLDFVLLVYFILFRQHKSSLKALKKLLSTSAKRTRHKRNSLNIMVTILAWFVEFVGFTTIFIGTHILGHQNNIINLTLQTITNLIYLVLVPLVLIIHESDFKSRIVDNHMFESFLAIINMKYDDQEKEDDDDEEQQDFERHDINDQANKRQLHSP